MKILVTDGIAAEGRKLLESASGIEADIRSSITPDELKNIIGDYQGVIIRSATTITAGVIEAAGGSLKVIGRAGIGIDNVDIEAATRSGIVVMNTPKANAITTAEHAVALMFAAARNIPQAHISAMSGKWERGKFKGAELFGKTLGLIGLGTIGKLVAERAIGIKMNAVAYDPFLAPEVAERIGVKPASFEETLTGSDFITIHTPLTAETKSLINAEAIAKMKDGAFLINCARGGVIDESALCRALEDGKLAGAALDVFASEPLPQDSPLFKTPNLVMTPHVAASTLEAQEKVGADIARRIMDFNEGVVSNAVNMPSLDARDAERMGPYMNLAEKLGSFLGQICRGAKKVKAEYRGEITEFDTKILTLSILKGFLSPVMDTAVSKVNAPVIASDRGIEIVESKKTTSEDYVSLITVSVSAAGGDRSVSGVIFGKDEPRFVLVDGVDLDVLPEGCLLISENYDKPGIIAAMCSILSSAGINIARMHLGRENVGGRAIVFTSIDSPVGNDVMEKLSGLKDIISIQQVAL